MNSNNYLILSIKYLFQSTITAKGAPASHPSLYLAGEDWVRANGRVGQAHLYLSLRHFR